MLSGTQVAPPESKQDEGGQSQGVAQQYGAAAKQSQRVLPAEARQREVRGEVAGALHRRGVAEEHCRAYTQARAQKHVNLSVTGTSSHTQSLRYF